ncbi:head-tail connector protein [Bacillus sp. 3255]|uniref:head-tail connector protein n=1 Tax=Bacillus sp. 3255 TaxID=2817904 RepID=UPI00286D59D8|nr:head-tail connector protein [Bacillus sp. 3255]
MELSLGELKGYLRIDGSEDDLTLALLIEAAKEYLNKAGVVEQEGASYTLAIMLYVSLHYENRDPSMKIDKLNFSLESIILQLKD